MALVSRLGVVLGLDSAEFSAGLGKAEAGLKTFAANSLTSKLSLAALATGITLAAAEAINFADKINDIAKANEVAVGTVLNLSKALVINGGESENTSKMFSSFTNKIDEAAKGGLAAQKSFASLGITLEDLSKLSQEQLLQKTMLGLSDPKMGDVITRNATAMDLFGKGVKGVDIAGLADDFLNNKDSFYKQEQAFNAIGKAMDSYDIALQKTKERMATDLAPILTSSVKFFDTLINGWTRLEGHINEAAKKQEEFIAKQQNVSTWKPAATIYDKITPSEVAGMKGATARNVTPAKDPELEKAQKIVDAMSQQSLELSRQINSIGLEQSGYEKLLIEFEKGGKYYTLRGTNQAQHLLNQQKELDNEKEKYSRAKEVAKQAIALEAEQRAEREARAKDVAQMAIKQAETYQLQVETAQIEKERLDYSTTLLGQSDTQVAKALALFDIEKEMIKIKKENPYMSATDLDNIKAAKVAVIDAQETNTRAANTFQSGWDKALANYAEKMKDSAALGADAFNNMASTMTGALDTFVETGKISFSSLISSMIKNLLKMQLQAQASGFFSQLFNFAVGAIGSNGGVSADAGAYSIDNNPFIGAYADGGSPPVGVPSLVGERGAELFVPRTAGTIIPNHTLSSMMGSQPQTVYNGTVVQNMSAIDTQSATQFLAKNKSAVWAANLSAQRGMPQNR